MPGSDLSLLRRHMHWSARRLARLIGVAPSTIVRNQERREVTPYVERKVRAHVCVEALRRGLTDMEGELCLY